MTLCQGMYACSACSSRSLPAFLQLCKTFCHVFIILTKQWAVVLQVVDAVLHAESGTQLVVLSGDMVSGFKNKYSIPGWFEQKYDLSVPAILNYT